MPSSQRLQATYSLPQRSEHHALDCLCEALEQEEARECDADLCSSTRATRKHHQECEYGLETPSWGNPICTGTQTEETHNSSYDLEQGASTSEISREEPDCDLLSHISEKVHDEDNYFVKATSAESRHVLEMTS